MKKLIEYKFKNKKNIALILLSEKELKKLGYPKCDMYHLQFERLDSKGRKNITIIALRPDELQQLGTIINYGLWKSTKTYEIGVLKGYNGFKF